MLSSFLSICPCLIFLSIGLKLLYQYISSKSKPKETISNLLNKDGKLTESDLEKAEVLNSFFASVFVNEDDKDIPTFNSNCNKSLNNICITEEDMLLRLKSIKINKSSGPDGIHPKILNENSEALAYPFKLFI